MAELPGKYIVIEGHDGTGKSTQVELLTQHLCESGYDAIMIEEPGSDDPNKSTPVADELRKIIKNGDLERSPEINLALFSAARRELWQAKIAPQLGKGGIVLSARNYYSSIAYQGHGEGLDIPYIESVTRTFTNEHYMSPDLALILTLTNHTERAARITKRGEIENPDTFESKDDSFQHRVQQGYSAIAANYGIPTIDASGSIESVANDIRKYITL